MTPTPDEPLPTSDTADPVDERLSAALDGEGETGLLDAPGTAARARALAQARDLLALPPPPLDDVTRRRLLDRARTQGVAPRRRGVRWSVPAAAAALVLVVGLGGWVVVAGLRSSGDSSNGSKAATAGTTARAAGNANLGEVSKPERLRREVTGALTHDSGGAPAAGAGSAAVPGTRCVDTLHVPSGVTPEVLGRATFDGASAVVVIGRESSRILVYVLSSSDCRLLSAQFFTG